MAPSNRLWSVGRLSVLVLVLCVCLVGAAPAPAAEAPAKTTAPDGTAALDLPKLLGPEQFSTTLEILLLMTVLSLAPSIVIMMTSFTRIIVVLALLRQALGTQQLPPAQVITGLAIFMTIMIMAPVGVEVYEQAIQPYTAGEINAVDALQRAAGPVRAFMVRQIDYTGNGQDVLVFTDYMGLEDFKTFDDVAARAPMTALIPAFMISELKTAFLMGFKLYLPFLIIDMVVASVLISMGMFMLPPVMISLPFKLLLFVLVDGWRLVAGTLLYSFAR